MSLNFLDLFSGIGGFSLGAQWAGFKWDSHFFSEVEEYPIKVYQKNFPGAIGLGDITKLDVSLLPEGRWILAGGFPCQDISVAGKGAGLKGERSGLWFEMYRVIRELRPQFILIENVGALTTRGLPEVLTGLTEAGYDAEWQCIPATAVGGGTEERGYLLLPTPRASMYKGAGRKRYYGSEEYRSNLEEALRDSETDPIYPSPDFCEALMGFPEGWTDLNV